MRRILPIITLGIALTLSATGCGSNGGSTPNTDDQASATSTTVRSDDNVDTTDEVGASTSSTTDNPGRIDTPPAAPTGTCDSNANVRNCPDATVTGGQIHLCDTTYAEAKCETTDEGFVLTAQSVENGDVVKITCRIIGDDVPGGTHFWYWIVWLNSNGFPEFEGFLDEAHMTGITDGDVARLGPCDSE